MLRVCVKQAIHFCVRRNWGRGIGGRVFGGGLSGEGGVLWIGVGLEAGGFLLQLLDYRIGELVETTPVTNADGTRGTRLFGVGPNFFVGPDEGGGR